MLKPLSSVTTQLSQEDLPEERDPPPLTQEENISGGWRIESG